MRFSLSGTVLTRQPLGVNLERSMVRQGLALIIFIMLNFESGFAQCINQNEDYHKFYCFGKLDSILLPSDFHRPDYFNYEEGSIIGFGTQDSCLVSILCGANAILNLDSSYVKIDTTRVDKCLKDINFYSIVKNRYARKVFLKKYLIMYENATQFRKDELDRIFNLLRSD